MTTVFTYAFSKKIQEKRMCVTSGIVFIKNVQDTILNKTLNNLIKKLPMTRKSEAEILNLKRAYFRESEKIFMENFEEIKDNSTFSQKYALSCNILSTHIYL